MKFLQITLILVALGCSVQFTTAIKRKIGAFNIQVFGQTKAGKWWVMEDLVQILKRYDLVLIQEIRDSAGTAIVQLLDQLNADTGNQYSMTIGSRLGRSSSKEEYCYFYKHAIFDVIECNETPDPDYLYYERPPYNVLFKDRGDGKQFVASALHAKPDDAVSELDYMADVYDYIVNNMGTQNVLMMGDFNADCSYVGSNDWANIRLRTESRFTWYIDDTDDTTVSSTNCAYDRFVLAGDLLKCTDASVFRFDEEMSLQTFEPKDVSDHYPIEILVDC